MREAYHEYIREHPEELEGVVRLIRRSKAIEEERRERRREKLALIELCREEIRKYEAHHKRR